MKLLNKINIFKTLLIFIMLAFLYLFHQYSKNGRYLYANEGWIIDTRTGNMYDSDHHPVGDSWYSKPVFSKDHK